eukprot:TRINITY_DN4308_c0_g3_i1.p2 TRINITY_DN4308_c0_g3~~TRINITY_DN4308_c0_g3_i1.p2  ORF type:complete len:512 (+),score=116.22 TRINITY_DN4308_c0_g3_i1:56-1537(+)
MRAVQVVVLVAVSMLACGMLVHPLRMYNDPGLITAPAAISATAAPAAIPATAEPAAIPATAAPATPTPPQDPSLRHVPPHEDLNPPLCDDVVTNRLLDTWRADGTTPCGAAAAPGAPAVTEYLLKAWVPVFGSTWDQDGPVVQVLRHVDLDRYSGKPLPWGCGKEGGDDEAGAAAYAARTVIAGEAKVLYRVQRFDVNNPYEGLHAQINFVMVMRLLGIDPVTVQFVFHDNEAVEGADKDHSIWRALNRAAYPAVFKGPSIEKFPTPRRYDTVVDANWVLSVTSIMKTGSRNEVQKGVLEPMPCRSPLFRDALDAIRGGLGVPPPPPRAGDIRVVWSSRRPYQRVGPGGVTHEHSPARTLQREGEWLQQLTEALGDGYALTAHDFGGYTPKESVAVASQADVFVGVHGAGMVWSAFLPRHGGVVELWGGDKQGRNNHYQHTSALADLFYTALKGKLFGEGASRLAWTQDTVRATADAIKGMPVGRVDKEPVHD